MGRWIFDIVKSVKNVNGSIVYVRLRAFMER